MPGYYDDNYGWWDGMDKVCRRCERTVRIRPEYDICGSCADAIERGMDY